LLACLHKAVAAGDDEGDAPPALGDDRRQLVPKGAELQLVVPLSGARMVRLGGEKVPPRDQLVTFDRGVVVNGPLIIFENLGGVVNTNRKMPFPR
jgi:hypothetical protein